MVGGEKYLATHIHVRVWRAGLEFGFSRFGWLWVSVSVSGDGNGDEWLDKWLRWFLLRCTLLMRLLPSWVVMYA